MFCSVLLVSGLIVACSPDTPSPLEVANQPAHNFAGFRFDASVPLEDRVMAMPPQVRDYVRELDDRPDYDSYVPTPAEMQGVRQALAALPPRLRRNLEQRGLGIYFIEDFLTSGLTDWVLDQSNGQMYSYMIFDAAVLRASVDAILKKRELSCFRPDDSGVSIEIQAGGNQPAIVYLLLHESVHALDYSERISPYVEEATLPFQKKHKRDVLGQELIDRLWKEYREPFDAYDFPGRSDLTFYGFREGPRLDMAQAPGLYAQLAVSPFVSLYGAQTYAEDLAEVVSMYALAQISGVPYEIKVLSGSGAAAQTKTYRPLESPAVQNRLPWVRDLLR